MRRGIAGLVVADNDVIEGVLIINAVYATCGENGRSNGGINNCSPVRPFSLISPMPALIIPERILVSRFP
jgi:hypothetical protein